MKAKLFLVIPLAAALLISGCAPQAAPTQAPTVPPAAATAAPVEPTAAPTEAPAETQASEPTPAATEAPIETQSIPDTSGGGMETQDIVDTAVADGRFTTLATALQAAGLIETLKGEGPFTVFAPTDEAFAKLPAGTVEALLEDKEQLTNILLYHVIPGKVMAADVAALDGQEADTALEGKSIAVQIEGDRVMLNETSEVILTDVEASNGVIHVIDTVLLPPE